MSLPLYASLPINETHEPMVRLADYPFINVPVYHRNGWSTTGEMFLRERLADKLAGLEKRELSPRGMRFVVYDGWRSREVQAAIFQYYWKKLSAENSAMQVEAFRALVARYVTLPAALGVVPPHSTGGSVDLGLWDVEADRLVDMGAAFDEFAPACANDFFEGAGRSPLLRDRRRLLTSWMQSECIAGHSEEYFHKEYGTQHWALTTGATSAVYGEITSCEVEVGGTLRVRSACGESVAERHARVQSIAGSLDLTHPAVVPLPLAHPDDLVRDVVGFADVPF